jgi:hypothetical protein
MNQSESSSSIDSQFEALKNHINLYSSKQMHAVVLDEKKCGNMKNCIQEIYEQLIKILHHNSKTGCGEEGNDSDNSGDMIDIGGRDEEEGADLKSLGESE